MFTNASDGLPDSFLSISAPFLRRGADRRLGYFGQERFVAFCYEPRGQEVLWRDSHSYGFASGAWAAFLDHIVPVALRSGVDVGTDRSKGTHMILIDRATGAAYFAPRDQVRGFFHTVAEGSSAATACRVGLPHPADLPPVGVSCQLPVASS